MRFPILRTHDPDTNNTIAQFFRQSTRLRQASVVPYPQIVFKPMYHRVALLRISNRLPRSGRPFDCFAQQLDWPGYLVTVVLRAALIAHLSRVIPSIHNAGAFFRARVIEGRFGVCSGSFGFHGFGGSAILVVLRGQFL